jgi:hypothetical protein
MANGNEDPVMAALARVRITPSVHSSLGPKLQMFDVVDRGPGVDAPAPEPRRSVPIPPSPGR